MFLRATDMDGAYSPAFFTIQLHSSNNNYSIVELIENATFIHEYIHFIQDLILPYSIRMNLSYIRYFNDICNYGKRNHKIEIPFHNWSDDTNELRKQKEYIFGSIRDKDKKIEIKSIDKNSYSFSGFDNHLQKERKDLSVYKYTLVFINGSKYQLGARDLLEYISYSIEKKHYNTGGNCPDFPYKTLDILFNHFAHSEIENEKRILIAEYCLHNDNPIHYLINNIFGNAELLNIISQNTINQLCLILPQLITYTTDYEPIVFHEKEKRILSEFSKQLKYIYNHSEQLQYWISSVNNYSKLMFQGTFIFTNFFIMPTNTFKSTIAKMIEDIGVPLIVNKDDKIVSVNNNMPKNKSILEYFYMVEKFVHYAENANSSYKTCPIWRFCKYNYQITCSKKYSPSQNPKECPYKAFLKTKDIEKVTFEKA